MATVARFLKRVPSVVGGVTLFVSLVLLTFVFIEGLSSTAIFGVRVLRSGGQSLRYYLAGTANRHAQYDPVLGWVGMPDRHIPDLYGEGRYLRTDSHGFRSDQEVTAAVPQNRIRAICTGDSFAFGQGVANDRTWCHLLSILEPRMQTVNMGQRGYGVDQAYLWYRRDGVGLEHHVLLFSFIGGDFNRMKRRAHHGYGKPILEIRAGELEVGNTPVPEMRGGHPWVSRLAVAAGQLRSVELGRRLFDRLPESSRSDDSRRVEEVADRLIEELAATCRERDIALVLIWLPVEREIDSRDVRWRSWVQETAHSSDLAFVDLSVPLRELPPDQARGLFISENDSHHLDSAGHYNESGNAWVARELQARLAELAELQALLAEPIGLSVVDSVE